MLVTLAFKKLLVEMMSNMVFVFFLLKTYFRIVDFNSKIEEKIDVSTDGQTAKRRNKNLPKKS